MRVSVVAASCAGAALWALGGGAWAQSIHLVRPADGAIVRETVPFRVAPGDVPVGGYASISVDGTFRSARVLPPDSRGTVYLWDTKAGGADTVKDGPHTVQLDLYDGNSNLLGTATVRVQVANQISPPSPDLKLTYHWPSQPRLTYHHVSDMTVPGSQAAATPGGAPPDQALETSDLTLLRTTEDATGSRSLVRDLIIGGTVTDRGQTQTIKASYNVAPLRRTLDARGNVLGTEATDDYADHLGFPVPGLPARRVGKGDRWQSDVLIPLTWDGSSAAHVTAECSLQGFEWQNSYPTAKILEQYSGPAHFVARAATASGHSSPDLNVSAVTYSRVLYFAYGAGRLIKSVTDAQITLTAAQLSALGGTSPVGGPGYRGGPGGYPGVPQGVPYGVPGGPQGVPYGLPGGPVAPDQNGGGYPGGPGGYPGGPGGYPGGPGGDTPVPAPESTTTTLSLSDTTTLVAP